MTRRRVVLVDDHQLLAQALAASLAASGLAAEVHPPPRGPDLHGELVAELAADPPAVVVVDLHLGAGDPTGGDRLVGELAPVAPVLVLTAEEDRARWGRCLRSGAWAVVSKQRPLPDLVAAVEAVAAGEDVLRARERAALLVAADRAEREEAERLAPFRALTPRERAVLDALVEGVAAADIAAGACVSEATVRSQIRAVLTKLGVRSQLAAAAAARRAGWARDAA